MNQYTCREGPQSFSALPPPQLVSIFKAKELLPGSKLLSWDLLTTKKSELHPTGHNTLNKRCLNVDTVS